MPDNKEKKQSWRQYMTNALFASAADIQTKEQVAEKERYNALSSADRAKEVKAKKRGKEKARREVSSAIYGDRDMKPPKKGDAAAAKRAADAAIENINNQLADISRRSARDYKGKNPLNANEARSLKRSLGRKMVEAIDSSSRFVSSYEYTDTAGRTRSVEEGQISGRGRASNKRNSGDGNFGQEAFGSEASRVRAFAEKLAGKNYSGSKERKGVYAKNQDGTIQYVKPKKGANPLSRRGKFNVQTKPTLGRPKGSGYDPDAGPFKKGQGPA